MDRRNVNRHHLNWERRQWEKNSILRKLRDHQGMVIPMNIFDHRDLHRDLMPPPKLSPGQAEELLSHLGHYDPQSERVDYLDMAVEFMEERNPRYAGHLALQRSYVLLTPLSESERLVLV